MTKQLPKGIKFRKDGGVIIHPDAAVDTTEGGGIKIPQVDTSLGAGFGDTIPDNDREFAAEREPVAHFLTYGMAQDVTDKWFKIDDPDTEEADPALDRTVQDGLAKLKFKAKLTEALEAERIYGWSLLVGAFTDVTDVRNLNSPLREGSELKQLAVYPKTKVQVETKDENPNSERWGEPVVYRLDRGSGQYLFVHYTRTYKVQTRSNGKSVLDPIWDDLTCGRNIRWGAAQWMYRTGGGFPVIGFPAGTTLSQLETWADSGAFSDIMARSYICIVQNRKDENDGMTFDFVGAQGRTLDPQPFFKTNDEQISKGSGVPQPKLVGAQAGAVTGSEINMQDYYKIISRVQARLEECVRWIVDRLADSGQLTLIKSASDSKIDKVKDMLRRVFGDYRHRTARTYNVEWNSAFELSELEEKDIELKHAQANQSKLDYMTVDEVRAQEGLDPLPNGEGTSLKKSGFNVFGKEGEKGNEDLTGNDKFLVVDLGGKHKHVKSGASSSGSSGQKVDS